MPILQETVLLSWGRSGRDLEISHPPGFPTRDLPAAVYLNTGRKFFTQKRRTVIIVVHMLGSFTREESMELWVIGMITHG
jgi:hypothetical protein